MPGLLRPCESVTINLMTMEKFDRPQSLGPFDPLRIHIQYPLTAQTLLTWETTLVNNSLYIEVPHGCLPDASKDAFVRLLEFAEDTAGCQNAIVYFSKDRENAGQMIRTFMFMGFYMVPPDSPLIHAPDSKYIYMIYKID